MTASRVMAAGGVFPANCMRRRIWRPLKDEDDVEDESPDVCEELNEEVDMKNHSKTYRSEYPRHVHTSNVKKCLIANLLTLLSLLL